MIELTNYYFGQEVYRENASIISDRRTHLYEYPGMYEHMCRLVRAGGGELPEPYSQYRLDLEPLGSGALFTITRKGKVKRHLGFAPDLAGARQVWGRLLELWHEYRHNFTPEEQQATPVMPALPWCAYLSRQGNHASGDEDSGPRYLEEIKLEHYLVFLLAKLAGIGTEFIPPNGVKQNPLTRDPLITRYHLDTGEVETFHESDRAMLLIDTVTNLCRQLIYAKKDYRFRFECKGTVIIPTFKTQGILCGGVLTLQVPDRPETLTRSYYANIEEVADNMWTEVESAWFRLTERWRVTHRLRRPPTPWVVHRDYTHFSAGAHEEVGRFLNELAPGMIITLNQEARQRLRFGS
ncbi:MAG: hypothetical protein LBK60_03695 [Verrucomicrobiales bacterium]|jgi:hypothetical protein|nr:hypothetical protein [Verrucomicrobiales bacterium]